MTTFRCVLLCASLLSPFAAHAAPPPGTPMGQVDVYATQSRLDLGFANDDNTGMGVKGWVGFGIPFVHFEYQSTSLDFGGPGGSVDLQSFRIGGGGAFKVADPFMVFGKAEYVDFGNDVDENGFGIHAGGIFLPGPAMDLAASIGYLSLNRTDGFEYNVRAGFHFTPNWGAFVDYRDYLGKDDSRGPGVPDDFEVQDIRGGVTFSFGMPST